MKLTFPSREFDEAVAAVCHGTASDEQAPALNELLRSDAAARDEYIARAELHSRLASEPDLFTDANKNQMTSLEDILPVQLPRSAQTRTRNSVLALAACVAVFATGWWVLRFSQPSFGRNVTRQRNLQREANQVVAQIAAKEIIHRRAVTWVFS